MSTIKGMAQQQMDIIFHSLLEKTELIGAYVAKLGKAYLRQACFYSWLAVLGSFRLFLGTCRPK